ncbi:hypothetical protein [Propioniciclava sinopodophylli]|uniref:hypothetical protein n=1 Tax=Propioniciclava sinopodophylli TaxID=1837344 RepID=UPI002491D937|nr:hypothetical protein [Propioniciclava sinopodophylli]
MDLLDLDDRSLAARLRGGASTVADHLAAVRARIAERDPRYRAFSALAPGALGEAERLDALPAGEKERLPCSACRSPSRRSWTSPAW